MNVILEKEYSFSNALFWNVMLHHHIQAFDEERDVNFDEVWDKELAPSLLDEKRYKEYWGWLSQIELETSENQGEIENPRTLTLPIGSDVTLTMEFHPCSTYYYLNDFPLFREHSEYIGKCILYGLSIPDSDILNIPEIGTICISNHSYRNALRYEDDKEEIKGLNILLSKLQICNQQAD